MNEIQSDWSEEVHSNESKREREPSVSVNNLQKRNENESIEENLASEENPTPNEDNRRRFRCDRRPKGSIYREIPRDRVSFGDKRRQSRVFTSAARATKRISRFTCVEFDHRVTVARGNQRVYDSSRYESHRDMAEVKVTFPLGVHPARITKWRVSLNTIVAAGRIVLHYRDVEPELEGAKHPEKKFRVSKFGRVTTILAKEGEVIQPGQDILLLEGCKHPTVMKDLCAECGADLREEYIRSDGQVSLASQAIVPMVHSIPELKVCQELAEKIGREDEQRLLRDSKLALLVDLDQTIVHTTNDNVPPDMKDVYHFQLYGPHSPWYHTRLRPGTRHFLAEMSNLYELHICTFGARNYAHTVAALLDRDGMLFSHRILSRDECFDPASKTANLKALFPCGDSMVCIIDDREDVWQGCGNLVQVKPYHFFRHTGDIHAPPGLSKRDQPSGVDAKRKATVKMKTNKNGQEDVVEDRGGIATDDKSTEQDKRVPVVDSKSSKIPVSTEDENDSEKSPKEIIEDKKENSGKVEVSESIEMPTLGEKDERIEDTKSKENESERNKDEEEETNKVEGITEMVEEERVEEEKIEDDKETDQEDFKDMEKRQEEEDQDDYLLYLEDILRRIHAEFYRKNEDDTPGNPQGRNLRDIIPRVRSRVLKGLRLIFSGMVATHQKLHQSRAYKLARALGAEVSQDLEENTTHLVAVKPGTAKVNFAKRSSKIKIVNPDWLWTCAERWEHVEERLYPLTKRARGSRVPPPHCSSPERAKDQDATEVDRFADSINPLMSFTSEEIANMDKEVEEDMTDPEPDTITSMDDGTNDGTERRRGRSKSPDITDEDWSSDTFGNKRRKIENARSNDREEESSSDEKKATNDEDEEEEEEEEEEDDDEGKDPEEDEEDDLVGRFRRGGALPDDLDLGDDSQESTEAVNVDDDGEWSEMGAALERGFLSD